MYIYPCGNVFTHVFMYRDILLLVYIIIQQNTFYWGFMETVITLNILGEPFKVSQLLEQFREVFKVAHISELYKIGISILLWQHFVWICVLGAYSLNQMDTYILWSIVFFFILRFQIKKYKSVIKMVKLTAKRPSK